MENPIPSARTYRLGRALFLVILGLFLAQGPWSADGWTVPAPAAAGDLSDADGPPPWPHERGDLAPDPEVVFGTLQNGFRYIFMVNQHPADRVNLHLNVRAGSVHEREDQRGVAHFLEHMLFNGSEHFQPGELVKYFQSIGMRFGADANARTGFFETVYDVVLPSGDAESLSDGLLVLGDYAAGALLLETEVERERGVILAEKRARDSSAYRTFVSTFRFELDGTRLSRRLPIGEEGVLRTADRELLKAYYDAWYRPDKMVLVMVGAFDPDTALPLVKKTFGGLGARAPEPPEPPLGVVEHDGLKVFHHYEKEAGNTSVSIEAIETADPVPDSFAFQRNRLLAGLANRILQDRLDTLLKRPETPFTSAAAGSGIYLAVLKYAQISADTPPEKWAETLGLLEQTLRRALVHGFTRSELERVKKDFTADLEQAVEKAATRESGDLARRIISTLNRDRVFQSPEQEAALYKPVVASATLDQVHDALQQAWAPDHRLVLVTGNADIPEPGIAITKQYGKSREKAVERPEEAAAVAFPYREAPAGTGGIVHRREISDLGILQVDFENGLRLNLKPTDFKANEILAKLDFGGGRSREPAGKPGLALLTEAVVNESGTGTLDRDDLERALAGKSTSLTFGIDDEAHYLRGSTVQKELPLLFQLLEAHLADPGVREAAYGLAMERFRHHYEALSRTVDGALTLRGKRFLAGGDSRFGMPPTFEAFRTLTLGDVREWMRPFWESGRLELSLVGDFDPEAAAALAGKYLGTLPGREGGAASKRPGSPDFPEGDGLRIDVETEIPKALVVVAYPTDDQWDIHRTRRLSTLAGVFSDRLRETVREELGAAYSPVAYHAPSRAYEGYGLFQALVHVAPTEAETVVGAVRRIAADLVKEGVTEEELRRSVDPTLTGIKDMRQQNRYWLETVLSGSRRHPEQLDWSRTIVEDYAAIEASEVAELARRYLKPGKAAVLTIRPSAEKTAAGG